MKLSIGVVTGGFFYYWCFFGFYITILGLFRSNDLYNIFRGSGYVFYPMVIFFSGLALGQILFRFKQRYIVVALVPLIFFIVLNFGSLIDFNLDFSREARYQNFIDPSPLYIYFFVFITAARFFPRDRLWLVPLVILCCLFVVKSGSRTALAVFVSAIVYVVLNKAAYRFSPVAFVGILFIVATPLAYLIYIDVGRFKLPPELALFFSLLSQFSVMPLSSCDEGDLACLSQMNESWRIFEAWLGVSGVLSEGYVQTLFGLGAGAYVNGPFDGKLNQIPVFHNGYITYILNGGFVSLIFVLVIFSRLSSRIQLLIRRNHVPRNIANLSLVLILCTLVETFTIHGLLYFRVNPHVFYLGIVCGFSICHSKRFRGVSS